MGMLNKVKKFFIKWGKKKQNIAVKSSKGNFVNITGTVEGKVKNPHTNEYSRSMNEKKATPVKDTVGNVTPINSKIHIEKEIKKEEKKKVFVCCNHCCEDINERTMKVSAKDNLGIYFVRCSCGFVNKMIEGKSTIPPVSDVQKAYKLFREAGVDFGTYAYTQDGSKRTF